MSLSDSVGRLGDDAYPTNNLITFSDRLSAFHHHQTMAATTPPIYGFLRAGATIKLRFIMTVGVKVAGM